MEYWLCSAWAGASQQARLALRWVAAVKSHRRQEVWWLGWGHHVLNGEISSAPWRSELGKKKEPDARHAMFEELLPSAPGRMEIPYEVLVEKTEGYSGSDIRLVCKEAAMQPLRRLMTVLERNQEEVPEDVEVYRFFWGGTVAELPEVGPMLFCSDYQKHSRIILVYINQPMHACCAKLAGSKVAVPSRRSRRAATVRPRGRGRAARDLAPAQVGA
ncbi:hypothetical protein C2845_PM08G21700 [Panicum miliaceum]|uniref:AAA ATPase AAA+ lid domain-containing protein n=1 Tax=Panicum miliaceum TaxID=4540 RepID=A0A3L6QX22_PANMI|nr:hypothetical protein C2845_PM08G21700 [Panicum miliaceum]